MPEFKTGDLVWVAYHCPHNVRCGNEYGHVFTVDYVERGTAKCTHCMWELNEQMIQHPKLGVGHFIPASFLRLIPPLPAREQQDERLLINLLEGLNARV